MMKFDYKKSLGQNFLVDNNIINKIVNSLNIEKTDLIIEIGPGAGALTKKLIELNAEIICFEIDTRLKDTLSQFESDKTKIIFEDFLKVNLSEIIDHKKYNKIIFIGNLPYYITTAIINKIVDFKYANEIVIMVQKEVAERFIAKPNTKKYNSLSVFLQYNFDISKVCDVSKNCFEPSPKVDSTVVKFIANKKIVAKNENIFYKLVKDSFKQKRKNLKNNLNSYNLEIINSVLKKNNKNLTFRAENLTIEEFIEISNNL